MTVTLWLLWSLYAGQLADVDSFLNKDQCEAALQQGLQRLEQNKEAAKAGNAPKEVTEYLDNMTMYGCTPVVAKYERHAS